MDGLCSRWTRVLSSPLARVTRELFNSLPPPPPSSPPSQLQTSSRLQVNQHRTAPRLVLRRASTLSWCSACMTSMCSSFFLMDSQCVVSRITINISTRFSSPTASSWLIQFAAFSRSLSLRRGALLRRKIMSRSLWSRAERRQARGKKNAEIANCCFVSFFFALLFAFRFMHKQHTKKRVGEDEKGISDGVGAHFPVDEQQQQAEGARSLTTSPSIRYRFSSLSALGSIIQPFRCIPLALAS